MSGWLGVPILTSGKIPPPFARRCAQCFERTALHPGDSFGNFLHISRFAAFAAIRHGRKIRTIGFQHEFVQRRGGNGVADVLPVLERDDAGEADERADFQNAAHPVSALAEAMKHPAHLAGKQLELGESVIKGVALVNHAVQSGFAGDFQLLPEYFGLFLFVARVVVGSAPVFPPGKR